MNPFEKDENEQPVADQYNEIAQDTSVEDESRRRSRNAILTASLMQGLDAAMNKRAQAPNAVYQGMRDNAMGGVADAQKQKQQQLAELLTKAKMQRQAKEEGQSDKKFGWEETDNDPNSAKAQSARAIMTKRMGINAKDLENLSYKDVLEVGKQLQAAKANSKGTYQQAKIEIPGKGTFLSTFNPDTGQYSLAKVDGVDGAAHAAYAPAYDPVTGRIISKSDQTAPALSVKTEDGQNLSSVRTDLTEQRAQATESGKQQAKDEQKVQEAQATLGDFQGRSKNWLALYDEAYKADAAGPGSAQISNFKNRFGFASTDAADKLSNEMALWGNQYIHDITGAQMPMEEFTKRFQPVLPQRGDDPQLIRSKMSGFEQNLRDEVAKRQQVAAPLNGQRPPPAAGPNEVRRKTKDGRTAVFNADTKDFLRYED